jgi:condensin-2 complex subunit G2
MAPKKKSGKQVASAKQEPSQKDAELARTALFAAVEDCDNDDDDGDDLHSPRPFLRLIRSTKLIKSDLSSREQKQLLMDTIQGMSKTHARRFFAALLQVVDNVLNSQAFIPESAYKEDDDEEGEVTPDRRSSQNLEFLHYAAQCAAAYLDGQIASQETTGAVLSVIGELFDVAQRLHDITFTLNSCGPDAIEPQSTIIRLCETWWLANVSNKEQLVVQVLPLIVVGAVDDSAIANVKRLYQMRHALEMIDFGDPTSDSLRELLHQVAKSPMCLKQPEGRKFLSYLFQIDDILMTETHKAIRIQIPEAKKSIQDAYAEIYFRAWKQAPTDESRERIESEILKDVMYAAIHVEDSNMAKTLLVVLNEFHKNQKNPNVEGLLNRLYAPILWRSLSATNALVRVHATQVLAEVFPLDDASHTQTKQAIKRGCTALQDLLQDGDDRVRLAASQAMAKILQTFWNVIDPADLRALLNRKSSLHTVHGILTSHRSQRFLSFCRDCGKACF